MKNPGFESSIPTTYVKIENKYNVSVWVYIL